MSVKIKQKVANLEKIDFARTFKLESLIYFGNYGIVRLVKYCFSLGKNASYRTPLKMSVKRGDSELHSGDRVWKIEAPPTKNNS